MNTTQFSLQTIKRLMFSWTTCTDKLLHEHCEHLIAPGTLGHIAQKTLHLAATNSTHGEHHNTNFLSLLPNPHPPVPAQGGPQNLGLGNTSFAPGQLKRSPQNARRNSQFTKNPKKNPRNPENRAFGPPNLAAEILILKFSRWPG